MNHNRFTSAAALLLLCLASPAWSQAGSANPGIKPAPPVLLSAFELGTATLQDLKLPGTAAKPFSVFVYLAGGLRCLRVQPNDIRSAQFQLLVEDASGIRQIPTPPSVTFRGTVQGDSTSIVAAALIGGQLSATVLLGGEIWAIQPVSDVRPAAPRSQHIVYNTADCQAQGACGVLDSAEIHYHPSGVGLDVMKVAEIAVDADRDYYQRNGSSTTATQNKVTSIVNSVDAIYRRDVEIQYEITTILVRTTATYTWNNDLGNLLSQFRSRWNSQHTSIRRDVAHLFTGKGSFSGVIGIAYVGVVCNRGYAYATSKAYHSSHSANVELVSHEVGHNWSAGHCSSSSNDCKIMCAGLGGCNGITNTFGLASKNTIRSFKNTRTCLSLPYTRPAITGIQPGTVDALGGTPVALTGTGFDGTTVVRYGARLLGSSEFTVVNDTTIHFDTPNAAVLGVAPVNVTNPAGTSNYVYLNCIATNPPRLEVSPYIVQGMNLDWDFGADPNDYWFLLASINDSTSVPFLGIDVLINSGLIAQGTLNAVGLAGVQLPNVPSAYGVRVFSQVIFLADGTLAWAGGTNIGTTIFF